MTQRLTRRRWASAVAAAAAAAVPASASAAAAAQTGGGGAANSPDELLAQARQALQRDRAALAGFKINMTLEPATRFEA